MAYIANPTDQNQSKRENASSDSGIPVMVQGKTRVIGAAHHTATYKTANGTGEGSERANAGVIMPVSDAPGRFVSELQGKA